MVYSILLLGNFYLVAIGWREQTKNPTEKLVQQNNQQETIEI